MLRLLRGVLLAAAGALVLALAGWIAWLWFDSRLPETYNVMDLGVADYGGGDPAGHHVGRSKSVADLRGPAGVPDERFFLTARHARVRLASGVEVDAMAFDGRIPGPELRVRQGDLVEVTLRNEDIERGVTIHWHGVDVPNGEDGAAGVTQDAVLPGERFTYRFRAEQVGTFWYHTHQASSKEVRRGLYGALVIEPQGQIPGLDLTLVSHTLDGTPVLNAADRVERQRVRAGTPVRLRLVNSDNAPRTFVLTGASFVVAALDGTDLNGPTPLRDTAVEIGAGGRADLAFTMPARAVLLSQEGASIGLALSPHGSALPHPLPARHDFDALGYGAPAATPFDASSRVDRRFELAIGRKPGFFDGRPGLQWTVNGRIFQDMPVFVVEQDDHVRVTIANRSGSVHPMHLHGHHVLVLSRSGVPASGSPWWTDTLNVEDGETYEVAFRADNPGLWMDHCHNLAHAAMGLSLHVAYAGISTPYRIGNAPGNRPE